VISPYNHTRYAAMTGFQRTDMFPDDYQLATMLETIHRLDTLSRIIAINVEVHAIQAQIAGSDTTMAINEWCADDMLSSWSADHGRRMP
jgi:hypothetical protein